MRKLINGVCLFYWSLRWIWKLSTHQYVTAYTEDMFELEMIHLDMHCFIRIHQIGHIVRFNAFCYLRTYEHVLGWRRIQTVSSILQKYMQMLFLSIEPWYHILCWEGSSVVLVPGGITSRIGKPRDLWYYDSWQPLNANRSHVMLNVLQKHL
mgnify:CR=1 FL=1